MGLNKRIVVINPNSNQAVTNGMAEALEPLSISGGPQIECVTLIDGPFGIESQEDVDSVTLDTDIKGYVSRDGGTTYTQVTLAEDVVYNPKAVGFDSYNKLLLHCDGAAGSTTFTDSSDSGHTVTANGSFELTTTDNEWKFGGAGATADGTSGTWLSVPDSTDWAFGSGNFTLDMWIYPKTINQILMVYEKLLFLGNYCIIIMR